MCSVQEPRLKTIGAGGSPWNMVQLTRRLSDNTQKASSFLKRKGKRGNAKQLRVKCFNKRHGGKYALGRPVSWGLGPSCSHTSTGDFQQFSLHIWASVSSSENWVGDNPEGLF